MADSRQQEDQQRLECPFCQFHDKSEYAVLLHIEALHTEDSPFVVRDDPSTINNGPGMFNPLDYEYRPPTRDNEETTYVLCPEPGCEEPVLLMELQTHLDFHDAEQISMEDVRYGEGGRNGSSGSSSGGSSGNSPASLGSNEKEIVLARGVMLTERDWSVKGSGRSEKDGSGGSSRSSSGTRMKERRENRTLVVSRDGVISKDLVVSGDGHKEREGRRERDKDRNKDRERDRGRDRERDKDRGSGYRVIYANPGSSSSSPSSSAVPARHLHKSPRRSFRTSFIPSLQHRDANSASSTSSTKRHDKSVAKPNAVSYKDRVKRLGKSDLGPYAHEQQMPDWLRKELEKGGKVSIQTKIDSATGTLIKAVSVSNETPDLLPVIALLCERDPGVGRAWLCHPGVKHVGKQIKGEGGFCGYRNIQMMISYIQSAFPRTSHPFEGRIPSILKIQDWIEEGWDKGINLNARLETGGIKGTRKYIGTSEAQTMFNSLGISCLPHPFNRSEGLQTQHNLLDFVECYFQSSTPEGPIKNKVVRTCKPPMYFQHSGHSMTIVGIEKTLDGMRNLLVFDPFFTPSAPMKNLIGMRQLKGRLDSQMLLKAHRRGINYLQKYKEFELIILDV